MAQVNIGNVSGGSQVAVGDYIVQIGRVEGGIVNILNNAPPPPRIRPLPVSLRPKAFPGLLDRQTETTALINALKSQQSAECTGEPGVGRTSLLRYLAHKTLLATLFPSGMVYFQVNQQSAPDLLKSLFDAFYTCDFPIKPNETEIRHYLQSVNALVLLDDVEIDAQQIEHLMNVAPSCTFVVVTKTRSLSSDVVEVPVRGLPSADAVRLFQNELGGRTLANNDENTLRSICESVGCVPLLVLRAAHDAGDQKPSTDGKRVLAALAVFSGTSVAGEQVAAVSGVQNAQPVLDNLEQRGLVQSHDQSYTLAPGVKTDDLGDRKAWLEHALSYFGSWTEQNRKDHKRVAAAGGAILLLLKQAVDAKAWSDVTRLGHASEEALTVTGKWDMWANVLDSLELAANATGNVAERAWVLHQLGTRALCLGDRYAAETSLRDALGLRERINDQAGAAATRHNLNILLGVVPPKPNNKPTDNPPPQRTPLWLKAGVITLVGLAALTVFVVWHYLSGLTDNAPRIASFSVTPTTVPANSQAQLCYEVENAQRVRIDPNVGDRPATKECINVTPTETLTYTLTAFAANGKSITQQATLTVENAPTPPPVRPADIAYFAVERKDVPGGIPQLRLCYEVHNADHAEIDNNIGAVKLNSRDCRNITPPQTTTYTISATGADGVAQTRQAIADVTKPPAPLPQIVSFTASPEQVVDNGITSLCYKLKDATTAQLDPGAGPLRVGPDEQCVKVQPLKRTTYTLRAFNAEGKEANQNKIIDVVYSPKVVEFSVSPQEITRGDGISLCFKVENASGVDIQPAVTKSAPTGPCVRALPRATTTYTIVAFNDSGQKSQPRQATVTVNEPKVDQPPAPHVSITRFEIKRRVLGALQICYALVNATSARIDPGIGELSKLTGDCRNIPSRDQQTYTLTAVGPDQKSETRSLTYTPEPPKETSILILSFSGPGRPIKPRAEARLCYRTFGEGTAVISPQPGEVQPSTLQKCVLVFPDRTTEYTLTVTSRQGEKKSQKLTVNVEQVIIQ